METRPWRVQRRSGGAAELHEQTTDFAERVLRINDVQRPALVLGSAQTASLLDDVAVNRLGFEVVKRRSGGGLVHLAPAQQLWVDLFMPLNDPLWTDDVSHSADWLGQTWVSALASLGWHGLRVAEGTWSDPELGRIACFAATGPGEVLVGDRKLVGISQRRDRSGARFQCTVYLDFRPELLEQSLDPIALESIDLHRRLMAVLRNKVASLGERGPATPTTEALVDALVEHLP